MCDSRGRMMKELFEYLWPEATVEGFKFYPGGTIEMIAALQYQYDLHCDVLSVHVGTNNVYQEDGTSRQNINTILERMYSLTVNMKRYFLESAIIFSFILPRV